ncbi:MAG: hypothetical protein WC881_07720, partial [Elusimicrobiota bacterium]
SDRHYYAQVRSRDRSRLADGSIAGNLSTAFVPGQSLVDFIVDDTAPDSRVLAPAAGSFIQNLSSIRGTTNSDLSGASTYYLKVWYVVGVSSYYWHGSGWGGADVQTTLPVRVTGSTGAVAWDFPGGLPGYQVPTMTQADGTRYGVSMQVKDYAGNLAPGTTSMVTKDLVGPVVLISTPTPGNTNYGAARHLLGVSGTATDDPAGVSIVKIQLTNTSDTQRWDGSQWVAAASTGFLTAVATNPWHLDIATWTYNKAFKLQAQAQDAAGNWQASEAVVNFIYDVNIPSSTILAPTAAAYQSTAMVAGLYGTALDWLAGGDSAKSDIDVVQVKIEALTGVDAGKVYDGTGFTAGDTEDKWRSSDLTGPALGTRQWAYPAGSDVIPRWQNGVQYQVRSRSRDLTGNLESPQSRQFIYDIQAPTTTITNPTGGYIVGVSSFYGSWSDALSGVSKVKIAIKRENNNTFWDGAGFGINCIPTCNQNPYLDAAVHFDSWSYTNASLRDYFENLPGPNNFRVFLAGIDAVDNVNRSTAAVPSGSGDLYFTIDHFKPVSVTTFPAQAMNQGAVTPIAGTAADDGGAYSGGSGVPAVRIKLLRIDNSGTTSYFNFGIGWQGADSGFISVPVDGGVPGGNTGAWSIPQSQLPESTVAEGYQYKLISVGQDLVSPPNVEIPYSTFTFQVDHSTPTVAFDVPGPAVSYISTYTFALASGTFLELPAGMLVAGMDKVEVQLQDVSGPVCPGSPCHDVPGANSWWSSGGWQIPEPSPQLQASLYGSSWAFASLPGAADWVHGDSAPDGRQYVMRILGQDKAGNTGVFPNTQTATRRLIFDATKPQSRIEYPGTATGDTVVGLGTITGTAADVLVNASSAGVKSVYVSIQNKADNSDINAGKYWNGSSWVLGNVIWNQAAFNPLNGQWVYNSAPLNTPPNVQVNSWYIIISSATDNAGNAQYVDSADETASNYRRLLYQPPPAKTGTTLPVGLAAYNMLNSIQGTANADTAKVYMMIKRLDTGACWGGGLTGFGWVDCGVDASTATRVIYPAAGTWGYPAAGEALPNWSSLNNTTFTVTVTGENSSGILENSPFPANAVSVQFYIDMTSPTASVSFPIDGGFVNSTPTLSGLVNDPMINSVSAGMKDPNGVKIRLMRTSDTKYWDQALGDWSGLTAGTVTYAAGTWSFASNRPDRTWGEGWTYTLDVQGIDKAQGAAAGNTGTPVPSPALTFIYDTIQPTVGLTKPGVTGREKDLANLSGVAADTAPGQLKQVQMRIQRISGLAYYLRPSNLVFEMDPSGENIDTAWFNATYDTDWTNWRVSSAIPWVSGDTYQVTVRSQDKSTNYSVPYSTSVQFVYDDTPPESGVTAPAHNTVVNSLPAISGTVTDFPLAPKSSGTITSLRLRLERLDLRQCWDGAAWGACPVYIQTPASGMQIWVSSWSIKSGNIPSGSNLTSGTSYYLTTSATDSAAEGGNTEALFSLRGATFTFDDSAAYAGIAVPAPGAYYSALSVLSGAAADNIGLSTVALSLQDTSIASPNCYSEASKLFNAACPAWFAGMGSPSNWTYGFAVSPWTRDHYYVFRASASDQAGNAQVALSSAGFTYEIGVPTATLNMPAAAFFNDEIPQLIGTAVDSPAGIASVELSLSDNGGAAGSWLTGVGGSFTGASEVFISTSAGFGTPADTWYRSVAGIPFQNGKTYQIKLRTRDQAIPTANERQRTYSLLYDDARPTAYIGDPTNGGFKNSNFVLSGTSHDPGAAPSGVSTVTISIQELGSNNCYVPGTGFAPGCPNFFGAGGTPASWTFVASPNPYSNGKSYLVLAQAGDNAGKTQNIYDPSISSNVFVYDDSKPGISWTLPSTSRHRDLSTVMGAASDPAPGVILKVELRVRRESGLPKYLQPSDRAFVLDPDTQAEAAWFTAAYNPTDWTSWKASSSPATGWISGEQYALMARSLDDAGNYSIPYASSTVVFDNTAPETGVSVPANAGYVNSLPAITGTLADKTFNGLNLGKVIDVKLRFKRISSNQCWDGASWQGCPAYMTGSSIMQVWTSTWSVKPTNLPSGVDLASGASYYLSASGTDDAAVGGNTEAYDSVRGSTFTFDDTPAYAAMLAPLDNKFYNTLAVLSGNSADNVNGSTVALSLQDTSIASPNCYSEASKLFNAACPGWFAAMGSTLNWNYTFAAQPWTRDHFYVARASATDLAGNMQVALSSAGFTYEIGVPTATLNTPAAAYLNDETPELVGTAADAPAGLAAVELSISSSAGAAGSWLTGIFGTFSGAAETFISTSAGFGTPADTWYRNVTGIPFENGKTYQVKLRTRDQAIPTANERQRTYSLLYDNARPTASISNPVNGAFKNANFTLQGGSSDLDPGAPLSASGVSTVTISIQELGSNNCYVPGTGFAPGCPNFFGAGGTPASWSFTALPNPYSDGKSYLVLAQAADNAGKVQNIYGPNVSSNVFVYDSSLPGISWTLPSTSRHRDLSTVTGAASDPAPGVIRKVELRVKRESGLQYFLRPSDLTFDAGTTAEAAWFTAAYNPTDWTSWKVSSSPVTTWVSGEQYTLMARSLDDAGNYSIPYASATVVLDNTAPETGVSVPANAGYVNSLPAITGTLADKTGTGANLGKVIDVKLRFKRISSNQCWDGASWQGCPAYMTGFSGMEVWTSTWSVKPTNLPSGVDLASGASYYLSASGTDDAAVGGNT